MSNITPDNDTKLNIIIAKRQGDTLRQRRIIAAAMLIIAVSSAILAQFVVFDDSGAFFERVLGFYTPSAGITRAYFCLLRLEIVKAFFYNQFFAVLFPFIAYFCGAFVLNSFVGRRVLPARISWKAALVLAVLFLAYGILRNVDGFDFLRPTNAYAAALR